MNSPGVDCAVREPVFAGSSRTLDPVDLARRAWKGYLTKQPDPWGMLPGGQATLRFNFDNRALPWPNLTHHGVDATIRGSHAAWSETVTGSAGEARVDLAINRASPLVDVVSCLPHRGELDITVKSAQRVLVRVPGWAPREQVRAYVQEKVRPVKWEGSYVVFDDVSEGQHLTVLFPLRIATMKETVYGVEYTEKWRGNTIVSLRPAGRWIPMFQRPELDTEVLP